MTDLTGNVLKAFNEIEALGAPVKDSTHNGGHFYLDGEAEMAELFLDYHSTTALSKTWGDWTVSDKIQDILAANGLFAEWQNPAVLCIFDA
jgi:hypothetical protein